MATHSSILAWRIPWTEEPGRLQSMGLQKSDTTEQLNHHQVASVVSDSVRFSRQEYWSGFPCSPPGDLSNPGIEPMSFTSPALAGEFFTTRATWEVQWGVRFVTKC